MSGMIYAAVVVSILSGFAGVVVGGIVLRHVIARDNEPRPVLVWLLFALLGISLAQVMEQTRVLIFRLSFDGLVNRRLFDSIYDAEWNVASSKMLAAIAIASASALKLAIYRGEADGRAGVWAARAALAVVIVWAVIAFVIEYNAT